MGKESLTDIGIGGTALTVSLWVQYLEVWAQAVIIFGSAFLVVLRLCLLLTRERRH